METISRFVRVDRNPQRVFVVLGELCQFRCEILCIRIGPEGAVESAVQHGPDLLIQQQLRCDCQAAVDERHVVECLIHELTSVQPRQNSQRKF